MDRKEMLFNAQNFAIYYGRGMETELSAYDFAIVEPAGQSAALVEKMHSAGSLVLAYVSIMEVNPIMPEYGLLQDDDLIKINGQYVMNKLYGNYMADLCSKRWIQLLMQRVENLLLKQGYDGLFLDTIANVEMPEITAAYGHSSIRGAVYLLSQIRSLYPDTLLIQNNGLAYLHTYTKDIIDGLCWENPPLNGNRHPFWIWRLIRSLQRFQKEQKLKVLIVEEETDREPGNQAAHKMAINRDFLYYSAPAGYTGLVRQRTKEPI